MKKPCKKQLVVSRVFTRTRTPQIMIFHLLPWRQETVCCCSAPSCRPASPLSRWLISCNSSQHSPPFTRPLFPLFLLQWGQISAFVSKTVYAFYEKSPQKMVVSLHPPPPLTARVDQKVFCERPLLSCEGKMSPFLKKKNDWEIHFIGLRCSLPPSLSLLFIPWFFWVYFPQPVPNEVYTTLWILKMSSPGGDVHRRRQPTEALLFCTELKPEHKACHFLQTGWKQVSPRSMSK